MNKICILCESFKAEGIKVIAEHLKKKMEGKVDLVTDFSKVNDYEVVIPYGLLASYNYAQSDHFKKTHNKKHLSLLVDAYSLARLSVLQSIITQRKVSVGEKAKTALRLAKYSAYECSIFKKYDNIMLVSDYDVKYFQKLWLTKLNAHKLMLVPNGVDLPDESKHVVRFHKDPNHFTLGFLGSFGGGIDSNWLNFFDRIWPEVIKEKPNVQLGIAGRYIKEDKESMDYFASQKNVFIIGPVDSLHDYFDQIDANLIVQYKKTGILNKVLDAFAFRCPTIGMPRNFAAFKNLPDCYYLYSDAKSLINTIREMEQNPQHITDKTELAYRYVKENHDWDTNYEALKEYINAQL